MPKIVDHVQYRKELLGQCFELFARRGYGSLTMRQIAQELEVSTGTLYHYFSSKEDLFLQLVEARSHQDLLMLQQELGSGQTFAEKIEALFDLVARHESDVQKQILLDVEFNRLLQDTILSDEQKHLLNRVSERYSQFLAKYLGIDDIQILRLVWGQICGLAMLCLSEGDEVNLVEQGRLFARILTAYFERSLHSNGVQR